MDLHVFPDWSDHNPYQRMLHAVLVELGVEIVPVTRPRRHLREAGVEPGTDAGCLHLHWTAPLLQRAPDRRSARRRLRRVLALLESYRERGGRLVWTVHNVLPHDVRYPGVEATLRQWLADHADLVLVMSEATFDAVRPHYELDRARTVVLPHASYLGCYPDGIGRAEARERLGLGPDDAALLCLGGIKPYKGLELVLDAVADLDAERGPGDRPVRVLVAGRPSREDDVDALLERCRRDPLVVDHLDTVPDEEMQVWTAAADVAVLPYRTVLNSGAFVLAETFGLPVVGPRTGSLVEREHAEHVRLFEPGSGPDLVRVLRGALADLVDDRDGAARAVASSRAAAAAWPPRAMAEAYAEVVRPFL